MALLDSELQRIRFETGYNVLSAGAEPYVSYVAIFDVVVRTYLNAGAKTTSSTAISASTTPALVSLTLASAAGFSAGDRVYLDVDARQESAIVETVSGSAITLALSLAHSGTYPVTVEGGEAIVRECLRDILDAKQRARSWGGTGALKKVDEVEFYPGTDGKTAFAMAESDLMLLRDRLCSALGVTNLWRVRAGAGLSISSY
jgi:hypothetical protein